MWFRKRRPLILLGLVLLLPLWMFIAWLLIPKKKLVVGIVDKTVLTKEGQEHISLMWVLNHERYTKTKTELYKTSSDYFGFFPKRDEKYAIKGLERFNSGKLEELSNDCDVAYITDAYGIYNNEWYDKQNQTERSAIVYGGMSPQDMDFLRRMKGKKKLILTEFNCLGSPTEDTIRSAFENEFDVRWTGWIGRYFDSFDTAANAELPKWLVNNYMNQNNGKWPFKSSGIAFVRNDDRVVILETKTHLTADLPVITFTSFAQKHYDLPKEISYSFWFDIMQPGSTNDVLASFNLRVNKGGQDELKAEGIPSTFPAIIAHNKNDYRFFYFCADFCDNPVPTITAYFNGIGIFKRFFYNSFDEGDRRIFFWNVYRPLLTKIFKDYYDAIKR